MSSLQDQPASFEGSMGHAEMYYRHSGEFTVTGVVIGLLAGILTGAVGGVIYAYAVLYCPIIYLNILLCGGFGILLGFVPAHVMAQSRVRNTKLVCLVVIVTLGVAYYFSWAAWLHGFIERGGDADVSLTKLLTKPRAVWGLIQVVNEKGAWSLGRAGRSGGGTVHGTFLWCIWAAEVLVLLCTALLAANYRFARPFCEQCQTWCEERTKVRTAPAAHAEELHQRLLAKDFGYLDSVGPHTDGDAAWCQLDLYTCPSCGGTNTLTMKLVTVKVDKKGKSSTSDEAVLEKLLVEPKDVAQIERVPAADAGEESS